MPQIITRPIWTQQPQVPVEIDWSNPQSDHLIYLLPLGYGGVDKARDIVARTDGTVYGTPLVSPISNRLSVKFSGTGQGIVSAASLPLTSTTEYTWTFSTYCSSVSQMWMLSTTTMANGTGERWGFGCYDATGIFRAYSKDEFSRWTGNAGDVVAGKLQRWAVVFSGGVISAVYRDGIPLTASANTSSNGGGTASGINVTGYNNSFWSPWNGYISDVRVYNKALSPSVIRSVADNPWQIFRPITRRIYVDIPAGSGSTTITVEYGSGVASGFIADVATSGVTSINASLATASASGYLASIATSTGITASLGSAAAAGYLADVATTTSITATLATATASGYSASLGGTVSIAADTGTATASGYAPEIRTSFFTPDQLAEILAYVEANMVLTSENLTAIAAAVIAAAKVTPIHSNVQAGQSSIADAVWSKTLP